MATQDWIVITPEDLNDYLVGAGMTAILTKALAAGQTSPFPRIMSSVASRIRAEISHIFVLSQTDDAIPEDLKWVGCILILETLHARIPTLRLIANYDKLLTDARDYLKRVNAGKVQIANPSDAVTDPFIQTGPPVTVISFQPRRITACSMAGL